MILTCTLKDISHAYCSQWACWFTTELASLQAQTHSPQEGKGEERTQHEKRKMLNGNNLQWCLQYLRLFTTCGPVRLSLTPFGFRGGKKSFPLFCFHFHSRLQFIQPLSLSVNMVLPFKLIERPWDPESFYVLWKFTVSTRKSKLKLNVKHRGSESSDNAKSSTVSWIHLYIVACWNVMHFSPVCLLFLGSRFQAEEFVLDTDTASWSHGLKWKAKLLCFSLQNVKVL